MSIDVNLNLSGALFQSNKFEQSLCSHSRFQKVSLALTNYVEDSNFSTKVKRETLNIESWPWFLPTKNHSILPPFIFYWSNSNWKEIGVLFNKWKSVLIWRQLISELTMHLDIRIGSCICITQTPKWETSQTILFVCGGREFSTLNFNFHS